MIKKLVDIAIVFMFACLFCVGASHAGASYGAAAKDRELAPNKGKAITVIDVSSYTYIELEKKDGRIWIAAPTMKVKVGDRVWAAKGIEMREFYSKALDRTFPVIHFVGRAESESQGAEKIQKPAGHPKKEIERPKTSVAPKEGDIVKAEGGYTLEELFSKKDDLKGKDVAIRGKIVKVSGRIMGKKWFHLQDGTGSDGALDLIMTSQDDANAGDIVMVTGILGLNKDFGQGYKYAVILESVKINVE